MGSGELAGVARTAVWVAGLRAAEAARADRLFDDRFAGVFVAAAGGEVVEAASLPPGASEFLAVRTRFFDDEARAACDGGIRQVVLLAAGLDCRAFRLDWPAGVRLFELDLPAMFAFKEPVLAAQHASPKCDRLLVPADLRTDWPAPLLSAGFDPQHPTSWVAEGLLVYLSKVDAERLLATIGDLSARESRLSFDYDVPGQGSTLRQARDVAGMEEVAAMWHGGLGEDPVVWLGARGWDVEPISRTAFAQTCARTSLDPTGAFLTAVRN